MRAKKPGTKTCRPLRVMKARATLFVTFSDGIKRSFRNRDQDPSYGKIRIPSSRSVSYTNLFVNGVLQPSSVYKVSLGKLTLLQPGDSRERRSDYPPIRFNIGWQLPLPLPQV
ncbi:DUF4183 domain-containing protein [Paenibacillus lutrae]|uniref:DUF4183 domain-containing protein n=1 Tax=Paenibacillus lutrae TaxID=2078573 RepID=UPI001F1797DE|nr:DUF4183 domain-containing protein [Paenibacillus lutrae]